MAGIKITKNMEEPDRSGSYLIWDGPLLLHTVINDDSFDPDRHWMFDGFYWMTWEKIREDNIGYQIEALADRDRRVMAQAWREGWDVGWGNAREGFNQDYGGPGNYEEAIEHEAYRKQHPRKRIDPIDIDNPYEDEEVSK